MPSCARKLSEPVVFVNFSKVSCPASARERRSSFKDFRFSFSVVERESNASLKDIDVFPMLF